jgi:hypothetical protein
MVTLEQLAAELAELRRRVEVSESVLAIQSLKGRYAELVDRRFSAGAVVDGDTMATVAEAIAALFTPDGVWDGGPGLGAVTGRAAIAARLADPTLTFSRHLFVNPRVDVDTATSDAGTSDADTGPGAGTAATPTAPRTARGRWDLLSPCRRPDGTSYWMCGYEDDEYERVDGSWLHRSMKLTTVFMAPVGEGWTKVLV